MKLRHNFNPLILLQLLLGLLWISFILWVRLFRVYLPKDWPELLNLSPWRTGYLSLLSLLLEILALCQLLWPLAQKSPLSWALERLPGKKYLEYLVQSPGMIFPYIFSQLPQKTMDLVTKILLWAMDFLRLNGGQGYYAWILPILVALVPLWIVGGVFAWEVWVRGKLEYFYLIFPMLLIPLLGRVVLAMLIQMANMIMCTLNLAINVIQVEPTIYDFKPKSPMEKKLFQQLVKMYEISLLFSLHEGRLDAVKNYFFRLSAPLLWACYLSGWGCIFWHQIPYLVWSLSWWGI